MSEITPSVQEVKQSTEGLTEVSEHIRAQLRAFGEKRDQTALPRGLYAQIPGGELKEVIAGDTGCSYGRYTTTYPIPVGNEPVVVRQISTDRYGTKIELEFDVPGRRAQAVEYSPADIGGIRFYERPLPVDDEFDAWMHETLKATPFATYTSDQLIPYWNLRAGVRAKDPLGQPVALEHIREGKLEPTPLDGPVEQITSYYDQDLKTTMARVTCPGRWSGMESTPWVPLDALEFYESELPAREALAQGLAAYAKKLIEGDEAGYMEALNGLLERAEPRAAYPLPYERRLVLYGPADTKATFVLGQLAADNTLARVFAPSLDRIDGHASMNLPADRVQQFNGRPWVIDEQTGLATPLLQPWLQTEYDRWSSHVADCSNELTALRAQIVR